MPDVARIAVAVGANLGDARSTVTRAMDAVGRLPQTRVLRRSSLYRSEAVGPPQPDYVNAALIAETGLAPLDLLDALQGLEERFGRTRGGERWGARELDLDIISFAGRTLDERRLVVPHPQAHRRCFVLAPLAEIEPKLTLPGYGVVADLLARCDSGAAELLETVKR